MKQPCDHCKAIRAFSGDPPKCEVCGWSRDVRDRAQSAVARDADSLPGTGLPREEGSPTSASVWTGEQKVGLGALLRIGIWGIILVAVIYLGLQFLAPAKAPRFFVQSKYAIALKYN